MCALAILRRGWLECEEGGGRSGNVWTQTQVLGPWDIPAFSPPTDAQPTLLGGEDGALLPEVSGTTDPPEDPSWARLWTWDLGPGALLRGPWADPGAASLAVTWGRCVSPQRSSTLLCLRQQPPPLGKGTEWGGLPGEGAGLWADFSGQLVKLCQSVARSPIL